MSEASPLKRRRTRGAFVKKAMKGKQELTPQRVATGTEAPANLKFPVIWPPNKLPVEIFSLIISYVPRSNILNLRLVNKEFDQKVAEFLFRVVVVPFRHEIYGITPESTLSHERSTGSVMLQDKGMRVFQGHVHSYSLTCLGS